MNVGNIQLTELLPFISRFIMLKILVLYNNKLQGVSNNLLNIPNLEKITIDDYVLKYLLSDYDLINQLRFCQIYLNSFIEKEKIINYITNIKYIKKDELLLFHEKVIVYSYAIYHETIR
ncbi:hypothetical protein BCR36DRAFT_374497 [Piromyces finnis]|uniref:L domain-like protein n=1 Tax=Piromyces finnis TaxID=1754191 RepID=A0A1Y1UYT2_9FUNG|nr:hypothetical protein BCR36DRAFT_374497 [Piromyces finnis]|eukprot:ORX42480.1 hypothetical protein BCR36DRAFT_374497 [Piromyces finnis]